MFGIVWDLGIRVFGLIVILISVTILLWIIDWKLSRRDDDQTE